MKRLAILLFVVITTACSRDYKSEIDPKKIDGIEFKIDSTKWTPALVQIEGSEITIYESSEIRKIHLTDAMNTFLVGFIVGMLFCLIIVISAKD